MVNFHNKRQVFVCLFVKQMQVSGWPKCPLRDQVAASVTASHRLNQIMSDRPPKVIKPIYRQSTQSASSYDRKEVERASCLAFLQAK